ncbi:MAG: hypothetical protein LBE56_12725 [Tannerella sp.]|jgi:hypothetical protein|nr:hypothetical protein [Tannerella sp.]
MTLYRKESVIDWGNNRITAENISPEISIYTPKYMGLTDDKYIVYKGSDIHKRPFNYGREVFEIISTMSDNGTHGEGDNPVMVYPVKYRTNNHLVMELKYMARPKDKLVRDHVILPEFASKSETTYPVYMEYIDKKEDTLHTSIIQPEYYFQNPDNSNKEVTMDDIQGSIMELDLANYPENNGHWILKSGYPYV